MALPQYFNTPPAYMGFVGFVRLTGVNGGNGIIVAAPNSGANTITHGPYVIRATTADITLSQEISKPDVVDSRYDKTVYQLGPKLIDGTLQFPAIYDLPDEETTGIFEVLYRYAATRKESGLLNDFNLDVKYASSSAMNPAEFTYYGCIVNTWQFAVAQSDVVTCSIDIIGLTRDPKSGMTAPKRGDTDCTPVGTGDGEISTTRIVTWADARVEIWPGRGSIAGSDKPYIGGEYVRSFEANINNDAERFYTLNKALFAQAVAPRKRDVDGNLVIMGRNSVLADLAQSNEMSCRETSQLKFGFVASAAGEGCINDQGYSNSFNVALPNVIFEIEEMSLTNDLFETTINWHALPAAGTGVCDPMLASVGTVNFSY